MEALLIENELFEGEKDGSCGKECGVRKTMDLNGGGGEESISSSDFLASDEHSSFQDSSSQPSTSKLSENLKFEKQDSSLSEFEMMRERFSKLLLGEDMSGCGNGVCPALAISNAITNLCATLFGQVWRLEPLELGKKLMWRRGMGWILSVSDHIVELMPSWQTFPDGSKLEVMTSRPRSDLYVNLPALRKLDNMLLEILDSFEDSEFWYVDQGNIVTPNVNGPSSLRKPLPSQEDKWWLPVPRVPPGGLGENTRKMLQHTRDCTNQILKAAMAINSAILAEMDIPNSYLEALPKNGKASLGDIIHRYINSDQFSPDCLLDCLDLSSDHHALEIANRVETTMFVWQRKNTSKTSKFNSKTSWEMVKDLVSDGDKWEQLSDRAESLLLCLKQRFPGLPQTTLDMTKIQHNKDVGKSILESYSRVLESLAFNIVSRIDDLMYVDDLSKHSDHRVPFSKSIVSSLHISTSPYKTALSSPYIESSKHHLHGFGLKRILTDHMSSVDGKGKIISKNMRSFDSFTSTTPEMSASPTLESSSDSSKEIISPPTD